MKENTCCFFGHRNINETKELREKLRNAIERLIILEKVDTFLFGSKSKFNDLCLEEVSLLKESYPHIKRIYVRAEFPIINERYESYLLESYEQTYFPEKIIDAGKAVYIERNFEMIDESSFCIIYYDEKHLPSARKSGSKIVFEYALQKKKKIINVI